MQDSEVTKCCSKCGEEKALEEFAKASHKKSGYDARCKECMRAKARAYAAGYRAPKKEVKFKTCESCGTPKKYECFSFTSRTPDNRADNCKECIADKKRRLDERKESERDFVRSICRTPQACISATGTKPCHGCSLSHKAATDEAYKAKLAEIANRGVVSQKNNPELVAAKAERFRAMHADPVFAASHAERNRKKLERYMWSDVEWLERRAERNRKYATSEESIDGLRKRNEDPEFQEKRIAALKRYFELRREDEEFDAFMERMEREIDELESEKV